MKEDNKKQKNIIFNEEEEKLLKKYLEEYNDTYPKILLLNPFEFFQNIIKGLELTLKDKINGFSSNSKSKIEDYLIEKIYPSDYKFALFIKKNIKNRTKEEISSHYFKGEILAHCEDDKCNNYYIHTCGEKFQFFKYKISNENKFISKYLFDNNSFNTNSNNPDKKHAQYDIFLFCEKCEMIYKSNFIKFKCNLTGEDFYSKIIDKENNDNKSNLNQLATWKHYHCNAVINDKMKCQTCNNKLYFLSSKKVLCKSCNKELNPLDIKYKCIVCKENFSSEAKVFNPLEYKALKICIKEAIISKIKAKPNKLGCGCDLNINKIKFIHRKNCKGELFLGELNNKKVVVCNKCDSMGIYDNYVWTCPNCFKKFRDNIKKEEINNLKDNEEKENKEINISPFKENKNKKDNNLYKTDIKSVFKNIIRKENINNLNANNKENADINVELKIDEKEKKYKKRNKNSVLKTLEKSPTNICMQSKLFTEIDNKNIIKIIEKDENNNFTNKKKRKGPLISSKLMNYTPAVGNKFDSKFLSKIPRGNSKLNKLESKDENIEVKNLENLFQESMDKISDKIDVSPKFKNRNISDLANTRNIIIKMHKAISSQDVRNKLVNNCLLIDLQAEKKNNDSNQNNKNNNLIRDKPSKTPICSSRETKSNSNNDNSVNKYNAGPIKRIFTKIKYNSSVNKECGESELIRIIRNIRQHQDIKKSRKKSANNSGMASIENEHSNIKKKLSKFYKKREINKKASEEEKEKVKKDMLKDFNVSDYKIIKQIGQGAFGQIFMVEDKQKNKYALKKLIASSEKDIKGLKQEYQILHDIQSNLNETQTKMNIVNIYGLSTKKLDPTTYAMYVLMELGNLDWEKEILERQKLKKYYSEKELMDILYVLICSLEKLQKENISHRDIKPQNILVFKNDNNTCYKLADFGEAKELLSGNRPTEKQTLRGTELYMSPILFYGLRSRKIKKYIKHNPYKSDVFSLGLCLLFAATLCFESLYDIRELKNNISIKIIIEKYLKKRYSYKIISIISSMLDINETTRDDFIELKKRIDNM